MELFVGLLMIIIIGGTIYQILEQRRVRKNKKAYKKNDKH